MSYITPAYTDQDHFTCARVLAFRERFMRGASQPSERVPALTTGLAKEAKTHHSKRGSDNLDQTIRPTEVTT
ncbi:MAG: hypothetical protein ACREJU_08125 [Nitrospiraceae bacterium]